MTIVAPHGARLLVFSIAALVLGARVVAAQPYAYILGQRDDPAPGNSGIQVLTVINTATNTKVGALPLELGCFCIYTETMAISPDGSRLFVANPVSGTVSVVDTATLTIVRTITANSVAALLLNASGTRLYVLENSPAYQLTTIDTTTFDRLGSIPLGVVQAYGLDITPDGRWMYVSTYGSNTVKVVDLGSNTVAATIPVGTSPVAVDVTPDGTAVYVGNILSHNVSVISTATNTVVATLAGGISVGGLRVIPNGTRVYVAGSPVIDAQLRTVIGTVASTVARAVGITADGTAATWRIQPPSRCSASRRTQ